MEITDKQITDYINENWSEMYITRMEDELLRAFKMRQEYLPSEQNDKDWSTFTDFVTQRRIRSLKQSLWNKAINQKPKEEA